MRKQLSDNVDSGFYMNCGLADEVTAWGYEMPSAETISAKLLDEEVPIEWARSASPGLESELGLCCAKPCESCGYCQLRG